MPFFCPDLVGVSRKYKLDFSSTSSNLNKKISDILQQIRTS